MLNTNTTSHGLSASTAISHSLHHYYKLFSLSPSSSSSTTKNLHILPIDQLLQSPMTSHGSTYHNSSNGYMIFSTRNSREFSIYLQNPPPLLTLRKLILSHSLRRRIAHLPSLRPHPRRLQPSNASWTLIPTHLRILDAACNNVATSFFKGRLYITSGAELYVCRVEESSELVRIPTVYPKQMANEVTGWWRCMVETLAGDLLLVLWNCDSYWEKSDFYFEVYRAVLGEEGAKLR